MAYLENLIVNASNIVIPFPARAGICSDVDLDSLLTTRFSGRGRNHVIGERSSRPPLIWRVIPIDKPRPVGYNLDWSSPNSMANLLYVDNSNVWIEGMRVSAVEKGLAPDVWAAAQNKICDYEWKLDFGKLFGFAGGDTSEVKRALLFGSRPPKKDSLWTAAERKGFEVVVYDRNREGKEKKIDTDIVASMIEDSYEIVSLGEDEITLVAGDADYVPAIEKLKRRGIPVNVVFWDHASREIKQSSHFVSLNPYLQLVTR